MFSTKRNLDFYQNVALVFIATLIAGIIFLVDINSDITVAFASMYSIVILYSWLLPGKFTSIYIALLCSILTVYSVMNSGEIIENPSDLTNLNMVISLVVIWTCVTLVFIAKSSFSSLESINKQLEFSSSKLLDKVKELDFKQEELLEHKVLLENLNEGLLIKNRELERFTNIASHDLQEPLRTIGNMTQLISKKYYDKFDDHGKKILDYVTTATKRLSLLIKGLLEFSRIGNSRDIKHVDCQDLVNTIVLDLESTIKEVEGVIKFGNLPSVNGNPIELRMLFQNLISNGLKFRKKDVFPIISVTGKEMDQFVKFCVSDNGIGIDEADFEKIFLIFQRLHPSEDYEGTGLGLANCRKIVELYGGKIWIDSKKGMGTSFYFTLAKKL